jgi:chromosome segregation ATPase
VLSRGALAEVDDDDDSDLDDVSSLSFSDVSVLRASASKRTAAVAERALEVLAAQRDTTELETQLRVKKQEVSDLRGQMQQMQHDKEMLSMKLDHLQRRYDSDRREMEDRHLGPARARMSVLESDLARAREGLEVSKQNMVSAIQISHIEYEQLVAKAEAERSVAQHIGVLVFDMMEEVRKSRDAARRETEALRQSLAATSGELSDLQRSMEQQHGQTADRQREQSKTLAETADRCSQLQQEVDRLTAALSLHETRSRRCQAAEEQCNLATAERIAALSERDQLRAGLARCQVRILARSLARSLSRALSHARAHARTHTH